MHPHWMCVALVIYWLIRFYAFLKSRIRIGAPESMSSVKKCEATIQVSKYT